MSRKTKSNFRQYAYFLLPTVILALYACLVWAARQDATKAVGIARPFGVSIPHSGDYYANAARRLEYMPHTPEEVEQLFDEAIQRAPADSDIFFKAFEHYKERNCCEDKAARLLQESLRRSPSTMKLYPEAADYFLKIGQNDKAIECFKIATRKQPELMYKMFPVLIRAKLTPEEISKTVARNKEGLSVLAAYLSKIGPSQKEEWLHTVRELHTLDVSPKQILITVDQAIKLNELDVAREYAEVALRHPTTQKAAQNMLQRISRLQLSTKS